MRVAIRRHPVDEGGTHRPLTTVSSSSSEVINGHQWSSVVFNGHQWSSAAHRVIEFESSLVALKLAEFDDYAATATGDDHLLVLRKRTFHCLEGACPVDAHGADRVLHVAHEGERAMRSVVITMPISDHQRSSVAISGTHLHAASE